ncbi:MAG TPA: peptidylprolyl isomerase, partial [Flavobacteriaceae bacterium]|nr:peptidylprolyl isomerase [Flavobacteriaceae bacterium]
AYYNAHKDQYIWNERANAVLASSSNKNEIKEVAKMLKAGKTPEEIKTALNTESKVQVIFTSGIMEAGHQALPEDYKFKLGQSDVLKHNKSFVVVVVNEILPKSNKTLEEAKGLVVSDYQNYKEQNWLSELHNKYKVEVNETVLKQVKSLLK